MKVGRRDTSNWGWTLPRSDCQTVPYRSDRDAAQPALGQPYSWNGFTNTEPFSEQNRGSMPTRTQGQSAPLRPELPSRNAVDGTSEGTGPWTGEQVDRGSRRDGAINAFSAASLTVAGPVARQPSLDIPTLLRYRLRVMALFVFGSSLLCFALHPIRTTFDSQSVWLIAVPRIINLVVLAGLTAYIWRPRSYSLAKLRVYEVVLFAVLVVHYILEAYPPKFVTRGWFPLYAQRHVS